jgi:hypothetical protein
MIIVLDACLKQICQKWKQFFYQNFQYTIWYFVQARDVIEFAFFDNLTYFIFWNQRHRLHNDVTIIKTRHVIKICFNYFWKKLLREHVRFVLEIFNNSCCFFLSCCFKSSSKFWKFSSICDFAISLNKRNVKMTLFKLWTFQKFFWILILFSWRWFFFWRRWISNMFLNFF